MVASTTLTEGTMVLPSLIRGNATSPKAGRPSQPATRYVTWNDTFPNEDGQRVRAVDEPLTSRRNSPTFLVIPGAIVAAGACLRSRYARTI
jgi:hypothetical protein